ncbi:TIR domain-containing protein [Pseudonocardia humida]|uniref:TIR domain-containing protein n=1 Tax=Pseudonocardia humida TaxID=2800819 RepID=UPI00207D5F02|nr:toll/interleukin-1 receptor domain-containing protein [Pseudonocardia humida]
MISYRRSGGGGWAGRLHADLARRFGDRKVFLDLDSIAPGTDFTAEIERAVRAADALVLVVNPEWSSVVGRRGGRRLDEPDDPVRREVETALRHRVPVLPVLVDSAVMPDRDDLPGPLAPIADINAVQLTDRHWSSDLRALGDAIEAVREQPGPGRRWIRPALAVVAVLVGGIIAADLPRGTGPTPTPTVSDGVGRVVFEEDFDTDALDLRRWNPASRPDLMRPRDGVLDLVLDGAGPPEGVVGTLLPRGVGPFDEVSFVASVLGFDRAGKGGAGVTVVESTGRTHRLVFGPSPPADVTAMALVCDRARCSGYDDYVPPAVFVPMALGEPVPMRLTREGSELTVRVRDEVIGRIPVAAPLAGFSIDLDGEGTESWHITVDSVRVRD